MAEKEVKPISTKVENIIKGIFLILIAVVMAINVGKIARTLVFIPLYLFGCCYYFLLIPVFLFGLHRLVKLQKAKITRKSIKVGSIVLFFAFIFILGYASFKVSGKTYNTDLHTLLENYNSQLSTYYTAKTINLFDTNSYWSSGLVGVLLGGLVANDVIVLFLGIALFVIALLCYASHYIVNRPKTPKEKKEKAPRVKLPKPIKEKKLKVINEEDYDLEDEPVEENPVINQEELNKRSLEPKEVLPGYEVNREPVVAPIESGFDPLFLDRSFSSNNIIRNDYSDDSSDFVPMTLKKKQPEVTQPSFNYVKPVEIPKEEPVTEEVQEEEEVNLIDARPVETPNIKEERPINEELVKIQPQFKEPEPMVDETPIITEEPKKRERVNWIPPSPELLMTYQTEEQQELNESVAKERMEVINRALEDFKIGARCNSFIIGPSITRFNIEYDPNVSVKAVEKVVDDISRKLGGVSARFASIVQGETYSGLEIPNATITTVGFKEVFLQLPDVKKHPLAVAFGKDISGKVVYADFDEFPHLLVAGTTGSGKSIYSHSLISTLIMRNSPDDLKIALIDPKAVEMGKYEGIPHLLCPIIYEADKANVLLKKLVVEMNRRYALFRQTGSVSNIKQYNEICEEFGAERLPYIIVMIDEYADLVDNCKEISQPVVSIAQKARAAGIHLSISTQRPSANIITGVIKGNLPTHVALMTSDYTSSITIIGEGGAETLLGKGDMLVQSPLVSRVGVTRLQGCFVQNKEILHIVNYLKEHYETVYDPEYLDLVDHSNDPVVNALAPGEVLKESSEEEENKYQSIKEWVMSQEYVSMSKIQRECSVGFNRAGRFFSRLQKEGVVASTQESSSRGCKVLLHDEYYDDYDNAVTSDELIG